MNKLSSFLDTLEPVFEKVGQLTRLHRILICVAAFALLVGGFFYFSYMPKMKTIDSLKTRKSSLQQKLSVAKSKARQLEACREKMKKAREDFMIAKKVLPEKKEIPSLLSSISQSGQDAGLEFLLFQPKAETLKDFYAEIPVAIKVSGNYHHVATFFDNVSRLFRIVNIQDIQMKSSQKTTALDATCTAVTYKFVESASKKPDPKKGKGKRRARRR